MLRPAFVVTAAVVAASCAPPRTRKAASTAGEGAVVRDVDLAKHRMLNPLHGKEPIRVYGETCMIIVDTYDTKQVDCPKEMDDPAWDHCQGGTVLQHVETSACVCLQTGNPPRPTVSMPCPK